MLLAFRRAMETEGDMERRLETRKQLIALDAPTLEAFEETLNLHHSKKADG